MMVASQCAPELKMVKMVSFMLYVLAQVKGISIGNSLGVFQIHFFYLVSNS